MKGKAAPVLASLKMSTTLDFYRDMLNFQVTYGNDPNYGIVVRGDFVIHFWKTDNEDLPKNTGCYLYLKEGIDTLYEEFKAVDVIHPNAPMSKTPYGMKEFAILDIDGNLLRIGQSLEASDTSV